jgi:hypothetical protein
MRLRNADCWIQTIALDALHALRKRVRVAQKEKLALRNEILRVRAERDQVALRMDATRIRHEAESKEALVSCHVSCGWNLSSNIGIASHIVVLGHA